MWPNPMSPYMESLYMKRNEDEKMTPVEKRDWWYLIATGRTYKQFKTREALRKYIERIEMEDTGINFKLPVLYEKIEILKKRRNRYKDIRMRTRIGLKICKIEDRIARLHERANRLWELWDDPSLEEHK